MNKAIIVLLLLVLTLTAGCSASNPEAAESAQGAPANPPVGIDTAQAELRELARSVEAVGTLDPNEEVTVSNQVEAPVNKVLVDLGDAVRKGDILAELDTRELALAVSQQDAALKQELARLGAADADASVDEGSTSQVRQAEAAFEEARLRLERIKKLVEQGVMPKQQLDEQQARYDIASASLKSSRETVRNIRATIAARKAALELAQKKLADAKVVAPINGFIKERWVVEGQFLKNNSPVATIVQNSPLKLRVEVPETAMAAIDSGRPVQFAVDAFPDRIFEGKVSRVSPSLNQQSRTLKLEAMVNNPEGMLKPGLFARVVIQTNRKDKALVVPAQALFTSAGLEKLFIVDGGKVSERIVRSGVRKGDDVEIVEGLKEGESVATSNLGNLQQGREVSTK